MDVWEKVGNTPLNSYHWQSMCHLIHYNGTWLNLKDRTLVQDTSKTQLLEDFWTTCRSQDADESPPARSPDSPSFNRVKRRDDKPILNGEVRKRNRAVSSASALGPPGQSLSPHHPALSLPNFLDAFGPLIFPLYKAALLRKRILLLGHAPVELACNFGRLRPLLNLAIAKPESIVYDISILSGIPSSVADLIPLEPLPNRLQPLFAVGVHDIQTLVQGSRLASKPKDNLTDDMGFGWVACTTDDILATKEHLFDALITIPPLYTKQAREKVWPKIEIKKGTEVKATQRDLRRYQTLRRGLRRYGVRSRGQSPFEPFSSASRTEVQEALPIENAQETFDDASSTSDEKLIEPQSWSAVAYSSFMWWASAGEKRTDLEEEAEHDATLLRSLGNQRDDSPNRPRSSRMSPGMPGTEDSPTGLEMAIIAYFHRLTALILRTLAEIIENSDEDEDEQSGKGPEQAVIFVTSEEMSRMGLDIWSEGDRKFVKELVDFYWGRKAEVQRARVECCGVRIC